MVCRRTSGLDTRLSKVYISRKYPQQYKHVKAGAATLLGLFFFIYYSFAVLLVW